MIKSVIKEIAILLLILIVVSLALIILFYDYNSENKIVSGKVSEYKMSAEVRHELDLDSENTSIQKYITTYRVDSADLTAYQKQNVYNAGKANPFEEYSEEQITEQNNNTSSNINTNSTNTQTNTNTQNNTSGTFFNTTGK